MSAAHHGTASDAVTGWLARRAVPLDSLHAGTPATDLQPLKRILDGVRVLALGEATHGTREFFLLKHRLLEFVVTELGFCVLAMEASESAAPAVDAHVRQGTGNAAEAVAGLGFWTWRTQEVLAMTEWMRDHNRQRPAAGQVRFAGIDAQHCGASLTALTPVLHALAPDRADGLLEPLRVLRDARPGAHPDPGQRLRHRAERLLEFLQERAPEAADALRHARILVRAADLVTRAGRHTDPLRTVRAVRDRYMADAVAELLDADPSARVVLWAHNGHIAKHRPPGGVPPMGQYLHERYGDAYYAMALLFGSGAFRARRTWPGPWSRPAGPVTGHRLGPPAEGTLEARLAAAHPADHLLDLRDTGEAPAAVRQWLGEPQLHRTFGAVVPRWTYRLHHAPVTLAREYDGLAYTAVSTPSRPYDIA
ncbi:erythromycin esterase family protein [Streptomyces sp. NPDC052682]|uniref:erythromycin esterase family protein n=1 Tax=Streptomyces sp. NPDC052682 TaxID=3154954 RepID=UPI00341C1C8E